MIDMGIDQPFDSCIQTVKVFFSDPVDFFQRRSGVHLSALNKYRLEQFFHIRYEIFFQGTLYLRFQRMTEQNCLFLRRLFRFQPYEVNIGPATFSV